MAWRSIWIVLLSFVSVIFAPNISVAQNSQVRAPDVPVATDCPAFLSDKVQCFTGQSAAGASFFVARPENWNGTLIVFAHGGPRLGPPMLAETIEDLEKFQMLVRDGYAWAGSTYRRGGYGVRSAAQDIDQLRRLTWNHFGRPKRTILHGQSWGGNVAAKAAELYALDPGGQRNFDGVILTSAVLAGGTLAYQLRVDLRAVYQYYCNNHPAPNETAYPLWQGLPKGATMTRTALSARLQACTGIGLEPAARSQQQKQNLSNITRVLGLAEDHILPNLVWATGTFQDLSERLNGRNPFSNDTKRYRGSSNDRALNAGVFRFKADPQALDWLAYDSDLSGLIITPTITLHGMLDPIARVCHQTAYLRTLMNAGTDHLLVQTFTSESEHSRLAAPAYPAVFNALGAWIETGQRPDVQSIKAACDATAQRGGEPCKMTVPVRVPEWPC